MVKTLKNSPYKSTALPIHIHSTQLLKKIQWVFLLVQTCVLCRKEEIRQFCSINVPYNHTVQFFTAYNQPKPPIHTVYSYTI